MHLAGGGPLAAAGEGAVAVPQDHCAAQVRRDFLAGLAGVQWQADAGRGAVQQAGAQERGEPGRAGQHVRGVPQQQPARLLQRIMITLALAPDVLGAGFLAQRFEHRA
jgi:hypothetical protein